MRDLGQREGYFTSWHWYIDRLADLAIAHARGDITNREFYRYQNYYIRLWTSL